MKSRHHLNRWLLVSLEFGSNIAVECHRCHNWNCEYSSWPWISWQSFMIWCDFDPADAYTNITNSAINFPNNSGETVLPFIALLRNIIAANHLRILKTTTTNLWLRWIKWTNDSRTTYSTCFYTFFPNHLKHHFDWYQHDSAYWKCLIFSINEMVDNLIELFFRPQIRYKNRVDRKSNLLICQAVYNLNLFPFCGVIIHHSHRKNPQWLLHSNSISSLIDIFGRFSNQQRRKRNLRKLIRDGTLDYREMNTMRGSWNYLWRCIP